MSIKVDYPRKAGTPVSHLPFSPAVRVGDLICVSNFPTATLDLPIESSQSNEALLFEAFTGRVPPRGTQVDLIFSAKP